MDGTVKANKKIAQSTITSPPAFKRGRGRPREFDRTEGLRKAMQVFWSLGYEATSMADIRETLGIKQASLYAAYGSKEELFREAVALYQETDGIGTPRALAAQIPTREAIQVMLQDAVDMFTEGDTPRGCLVVLSTINCTVENRGIQEYLSALRRQTLARIEARLQRGQCEGDVAETASIAVIAAFYTTVLHGLSIRAKDGATRKTLTQVVDCSMSAWDHLAKE